jgi:hypothetical protein
LAGWLTLQRWGFESALAMDSYAARGVMMQEFRSRPESSGGLLRSIQDVQFRDGSLVGAFFSEKARWRSVGPPLGLLLAGALVFLVISHVFLRRRFGLASSPVWASKRCRGEAERAVA